MHHLVMSKFDPAHTRSSPPLPADTSSLAAAALLGSRLPRSRANSLDDEPIGSRSRGNSLDAYSTLGPAFGLRHPSLAMSSVPASSPIPTPQNLLQMSRMRGDSLYDDPLSARPMISTPRSRFDSITDSVGIRPRGDSILHSGSDRRLDALADEARAVAELQAAVAQHSYHLPRSPTSGVNFATRRVRVDSSAADEALHDSATDMQNTMRVPVLSSVTSVGDLATRRNLSNASSSRKDLTSRNVEFESAVASPPSVNHFAAPSLPAHRQPTKKSVTLNPPALPSGGSSRGASPGVSAPSSSDDENSEATGGDEADLNSLDPKKRRLARKAALARAARARKKSRLAEVEAENALLRARLARYEQMEAEGVFHHKSDSGAKEALPSPTSVSGHESTSSSAEQRQQLLQLLLLQQSQHAGLNSGSAPMVDSPRAVETPTSSNGAFIVAPIALPSNPSSAPVSSAPSPSLPPGDMFSGLVKLLAEDPSKRDMLKSMLGK